MKNLTIQELLINSLKKHANEVAIEYGKERLTYLELDRYSNAIANQLQQQGGKKGSVIAILENNNIALIATVLAVLKIAGVFVPLNPTYPGKRNSVMIDEANVDLIVCGESLIAECENITRYCVRKPNMVIMNEMSGAATSDAVTSVGSVDYNTDDMVYIYYTSGTTGHPKAVAGRNNSLLHFILWEINTFDIGVQHRFSQFTPPCHDPFMRDIFTPLCSGARICTPQTKEVILKGSNMKTFIEESKINIIHCTPSLFKIFASGDLREDSYPDLSYVFLAGEKIAPEALKNWYETIGERVQLINLYGPTETTLAKVFYLITPTDVTRENIPIGKAIDGAKIIILDQNMNVCNQGDIGEIYIRTPYRTLGYYNDAQLTKQRFIPNPFSNSPDDLIYKTGDLGRILSDGNLEFSGRVDRQVKIRGFRIELSEIENLILKFADVSDCVVTYKQSPNTNNGFLDAYYVAGKKISGDDIRHYLEDALPDYMIPARYVQLDDLPLTSNNKIDYQKLPEPNNIDCVADGSLPEDEVEQTLVDIWCEILGIWQVGTDEQFLKVGGNSLNIMNLVSEVYEVYEVDVPLGLLFKNITIKELAEYIKETTGDKSTDNTLAKQAIALPDEYFTDVPEPDLREQLLTFQMNDYNFTGLQSDVYVDVFDILITLYMVLLYEISKNSSISVFVSLGIDEISIINIDISENSDIADLAQTISESRKSAGEKSGYKISDLNRMMNEKDSNTVFVSFLDPKKLLKNTQAGEIFDFGMQCIAEESQIELRFTFLNRRLNHAKMESFFNTYVNMIEAFGHMPTE